MQQRVLGVDPGLAASGWALVVAEGNRYHLEDRGVIRPKGEERALKLARLHDDFSELVARLRPTAAAVESAFSGRNPRSGLSLAESRGVLLAVLGRYAVPVSSYSPAEVKSAIVGHGRAEKAQIVYMIVRLLHLSKAPPQDAADAAGVALTHLHCNRWKGLS